MLNPIAAYDDRVVDDSKSVAYISTSNDADLSLPERIRLKRNYLFSMIPQCDAWRIQVDELALYSITEYNLAASMTERIVKALEQSWGG